MSLVYSCREMQHLGIFVLILHVSLSSTIRSTVQPSNQNATVDAQNEKDFRDLRLVGQLAPCIGKLEIYYRGQWNSVCSGVLDSAAGKVICKQILCSSFHTLTTSPNPQETGPILLDRIQCNGTESSLWDCSFTTSSQQTCETGTSAVIFCKVQQSAILQGGGSPCAGTVQARSFGVWNIICGRMWDLNDAHVLCKYLGCGDALSASGNSQFAVGNWPVLNFEIGCKGSEEDPWKCELKQLAHNNCSREVEAAGVVCSGHKQPRLVGGVDECSGRLEIQKGMTWGTVCYSHWDSLDARVVCTSLKCGEVISVLSGAQFGEGSGPIWQDVYECQGNETVIWDCPITSSNQRNCTHSHDVSIICSGQKGPRLVGGDNTCSGRVEILMGDTWGTVCDTYWDLQNANVVCNQLGCGTAISTPGGALFGEGDGLIWMHIIECNGNEMRLTDCPFVSWGQHRCTHRNDAGVICSGEDWQLRLANGESICEGLVEVYYDGVWGRVIDTQWNFNEAEVVCRQLKCGSAISIYNQLKFGKGTGPTWISNVRCNGSEPFLWNCTFTKTEQSSIGDDVGVVCSDHIQIRLVDGGNRCAGRVELYSNGTWGTVCDDSWDLTDAQVVCNQLKCGQALNATISGWFGPGLGPIWLDNVNCSMNESVLWECLAGPWSESDCNHKEDAGVICLELSPRKIHNQRDSKKSEIRPVPEHLELRLTAGFDNCSGRVEIFFSGTWGTVCDDSWDKQDAAVVCQQLNCGGPIWTVGGMIFDQGNGTIWMDEVKCKGTELFLWDCQLSAMGDHDCDHKEDVNVICSGQQKLIAPFNQESPPTFIIPSILVILLIAVSLALAAELQRSFQKANKNRNFDPVYEEIKAQDIGAGPDLFPPSDAELEREYDEIQITRTSLIRFSFISLEHCRREMHRLGVFVLIVHVSMELRNPTLLGPHAPCGGILKVYDRGQWKSVCSNSWDSAAGEVVCKQIGCEFYLSGQVHPIPHGPAFLDKIQCKGTESSLSECALSPSGQQKCDTEMSVIVICNGAVQQNLILGDGGSPCAGRLQVYLLFAWHHICGQTWDMNDARVLCKYLRCGEAVSASASQFGDRNLPILNLEIGCKGSENNPWDCEITPVFNRRCSREVEPAGVICSGHKQPRLIGGAGRCAGRLEIQKGMTWGTVCDSHWDTLDANVVCTSLECGEVVTVRRGAQFGEGSGPIWQDVYECQGTETILWSCPTTQINQKNCTHRHDVSIICSGKRRPRLIGGNDTCSGRVEIMFDDTWNTVCDTYWDLQDAAVVCNQLGCGAAISTPGGAYFGEGNGPVWNYIHVCTGNEIRLTDCPIASRGHRECTHRNDASVICSGEDWQLRLANGEGICEGRVEVYYDGVWGRVTDTQWNFNEAEVVCRQLKCGSAISIYNQLKFGKGTGPTLISNVRCNGSEPFLWNCTFTKSEQSSIGDDVGVVCSGMTSFISSDLTIVLLLAIG
ncbi:deleted in malignant brain tumors 1 protein-like [Chiloscyllium plagiosum]|uniref:deleted in malignant brain tumors 1 protein-like n=1 Tax=Chiloscyllium plagiosum TaxID=36176 RepID=UPI001CB82E3B|nr:deleted in malignant brain tumors 1 protein-like [Chiloscyllium plagiosum]